MKNYFRAKLGCSSIGKKIWSILHRANILLMRLFSDEVYFKYVYKQNSGKKLDFGNPQTFDEKQLWLKMYYRNPLCVTCSDKYKVREYVESLGLGHILNPLYGVYDSAEKISWDKLPNRFYLKANNASGINLRCNDKRHFDKKKAEKYFHRKMKHNYYYESREWNYKNISPKIIAEAIIDCDDSVGLVDYRFLCYNGKCEYVFIDIETADQNGAHYEGARRNVYDREMNLLDVKVSRDNFSSNLIKRPESWGEMISCAEKLSGNFPFCRVDLYNIKDRILFGEITFFHSGGLSKITPEEWQYKLGENIDIDLAKTQINMEYQYNSQWGGGNILIISTLCLNHILVYNKFNNTHKDTCLFVPYCKYINRGGFILHIYKCPTKISWGDKWHFREKRA